MWAEKGGCLPYIPRPQLRGWPTEGQECVLIICVKQTRGIHSRSPDVLIWWQSWCSQLPLLSPSCRKAEEVGASIGLTDQDVRYLARDLYISLVPRPLLRIKLYVCKSCAMCCIICYIKIWEDMLYVLYGMYNMIHMYICMYVYIMNKLWPLKISKF